jgi:cellulose synthase/poly-beta-1,6-N-acetylglucosamine synthase-like glycosyltransferase
LTDSIRKRNAIAVCGVVNVDKSSGNWFWNNLQNYQYLYGQYTRRTTEDLVNQVLCLPGCISMFLLCNRTIGAQQLYSEIPDTSDLTVSNVQYVGTDRRYTSSLIYSDSSSKIVMDTRCHAYTVPPQSIAAYISQRRRWCQNTYFNTMINIIAPNVNFMLRVFCLVDYLRLSLV